MNLLIPPPHPDKYGNDLGNCMNCMNCMKSYQELLVLREVHTIKIRDKRFDARNNLCQ